MSTLKTYAGWIVALIAIVILVIIVVHSPAVLVGATPGVKNIEDYSPYVKYNGGISTALPISTSDALTTSGTFAIGSSGSSIAGLNYGTCYIGNMAATIAASSTKTVDCQGTALWESGLTALTGVTSSDIIFATLVAASSTTNMGINLQNAIASTTAGYIRLQIANNTGATYTWPTSGPASGTVSYLAINP